MYFFKAKNYNLSLGAHNPSYDTNTHNMHACAHAHTQIISSIDTVEFEYYCSQKNNIWKRN